VERQGDRLALSWMQALQIGQRSLRRGQDLEPGWRILDPGLESWARSGVGELRTHGDGNQDFAEQGRE
jgi:hypothetical protein